MAFKICGVFYYCLIFKYKSLIKSRTGMRKILLTQALLLCTYAVVFAQNKYVCFQNDKNPDLQLSVTFNAKHKAISAKYKGQADVLTLQYVSIKKSPNPGGHPAAYWSETYTEKYKGKTNGTYVFTNAGTHGLDVTYTRKKDGKEFYFMVNENLMNPNGETYRDDACF
jgi:hypothetical protein